MEKSRSRSPTMSRGMSLMLTALVLPAMFAFVSVAVDTAILATARAQLKTVADAAALAGAMQLADNVRIQGSTNLSPEITNAQTRAQAAGQANSVLGQAAVLLPNSNNSASGDTVVGYFNPSTRTWTPPPLSNSLLTNAMSVNAIRANDHVGPVPTFFSRVMGFTGSSMTVSSIAMVQNYTIGGFKTVNNLDANLLPIVLDQTTYNAMIARTTQDQYSYNPATGTVTNGPDGIPESVLYPVGSGSPGNWGTVKIGVSNNSTSTLAAQIQYGITPAQLATFPGGVIQLDNTQTPPSITLSGNPGISAGIKSAVDAIIGNPVTIPIYDINGGNGNNAWYRVVAFAGVRVMASNFQGNPKYVVVQPALVYDPTAVVGPVQSAWTSGGKVVVNLVR
jgi:hypothetical protein